MTDRALSLPQIANTAMQVAMDLGFNAVDVVPWVDMDNDFEECFVVRFGPYDLLRSAPKLNNMDWAMAYDAKESTKTHMRIAYIPAYVRYGSTGNLKYSLLSKFMEFA